MNNQSLFVKIVVWFMVFLMSVGFVALVIAPFAGGSLFGQGGGREATEKLVAEAREDVRRDECADAEQEFTGERLERCKEALTQLASAYTTLARGEQDQEEMPRDAIRNYERAGDAFQRLYEIDTSDDDNAALYAGYLRDSGDARGSLEIWDRLVEENPGNEDYLLQKAGAHQQLQELDEAIAALQQYVEQFPDSGRIDSIREQIRGLERAQEQQAEGGGPGGAPITVG
jgi:tetratricopeptide (TPR) repeat protein